MSGSRSHEAEHLGCALLCLLRRDQDTFVVTLLLLPFRGPVSTSLLQVGFKCFSPFSKKEPGWKTLILSLHILLHLRGRGSGFDLQLAFLKVIQKMLAGSPLRGP